MSKYKFDRFDHIDKLDIVMKYREVKLLIAKDNALPYALFGIDKYNTDTYEPLCLGVSIEEINYKLNKICEILDNNNIKYSIKREV